MSRKTILKVEGLSREFDVKKKSLTGEKEKLKAVQDVSLAVSEGETLGIVGESGCGEIDPRPPHHATDRTHGR